MIVGLTGNFGSGKSTVLKIFNNLGVLTISADEVVHRLLPDHNIKREIVSIAGDVLDDKGEIDRAKLANVIFNNDRIRVALESLIHPIVMNEIRAFGKKNRDKLVIAEIPLLFEGRFQNNVYKTITVFIDKELVHHRLAERGYSEELINKRLAVQLPSEKKEKLSDIVIDNSGRLDDTKKKVEEVYEQLRMEIKM